MNFLFSVLGSFTAIFVGIVIYAGVQAHKDIKNFKSRDNHDMFV